MSTVTTANKDADMAATLYRTANTSDAKWKFLDHVVGMIAARPDATQAAVIDTIGDTAAFTEMHGNHRASGAKGAKARSRLKSIRDEVSVAKKWAPSQRVDGISFEAHKLVNRLGPVEGGKVLRKLADEHNGPANVTKPIVQERLALIDPNHKKRKNGKTATGSTGSTSTGSTGSTSVTVRDMTVEEMAAALSVRLTVGMLAKDPALASSVVKIADTFESFAKRKAKQNAAKAKAKAPASTPTPAKARSKAKAPAVKAPSARPARAKVPSVKAPSVKAPSVKASAA